MSTDGRRTISRTQPTVRLADGHIIAIDDDNKHVSPGHILVTGENSQAYWKKAEDIGISKNGPYDTTWVNIDNSKVYTTDKIGIGTNSVTNALDVSGDVSITHGKLLKDGVEISPYIETSEPLKTFDINQGTSKDTITDGFAKIDNFFYKYMVDQPGVVSGIQSYCTATAFGFAWTLPEQVVFPFSASKLPTIKHISLAIRSSNGVNLLGDGVTGTIGVTNVLDKNEDYVPEKQTEIRGILFTNVLSQGSGGSGSGGGSNFSIQNRTIGSYTSVPCLIVENAGFSRQNVGSHLYVEFFYSNNSNLLPKKIGFHLPTYKAAHPPSEVVAMTSVALSSTSLQLNWEKPLYSLYAGAGNNENILSTDVYGPAMQEYEIEYSAYNSRRYTGVVNTIVRNVVVSGGGEQTILTGLYPATEYRIRIRAKNNIHGDFGPISSYFYTVYTTAPAAPNSVTMIGDNIFDKPVYNGTVESNNISIYSAGDNVQRIVPYINKINSGNSYVFSKENLGPLQIHNEAVVGSIAPALTTLSLYVDNLITPKVEIPFGGFETGNSITSQQQNGVRVDNIQKRDAYSSGGSMYNVGDGTSAYLQLYQEILFTIGIQRTLLFPQNEPHSIQFKQTIQNNSVNVLNNDKIFRVLVDDVDNVVGGGYMPSFVFGSADESALQQKITVCGIPIVSSNNGQYVDIPFTLNNIGKYYYRGGFYKLDVCRGLDVGGVLIMSRSPTGMSSSQNGNAILDQSIVFTERLAYSDFPSTFTTGLRCKGKAYNIHNESAETSESVIELYHIFDKATSEMVRFTSMQSPLAVTAGDTGVYGCRMTSGGADEIVPFSSQPMFDIFDDTQNIAAWGSVDVPFINGYYRTAGAIPLSINLDFFNYGGYDYSMLHNDTGYRWVTFGWRLSKDDYTVEILNFIVDELNTNVNIRKDDMTNTILSDDNSWKVYFRFEEEGCETPVQGNSCKSSIWFNANMFADSFTNSYSNINRNGSIGGLIYGDSIVSGNQINYSVVCHSFNPYWSSNNNVRIYLRIGMKMDKLISFKGVRCSYKKDSRLIFE
jgi:hypothetical protein